MILKFKQLFKINYRHYICIAFTLISLLLAFFYFKYAYLRLFESFEDIFNSLKYYISELFDLNWNVEVTVNNFTVQPFKMPFNLPNTWEEFEYLVSEYFDLLFTIDNLKAYFKFLSKILYYVSKFLLLIMPILLLLMLLKKGDRTNNDFNIDSKALKTFKKFQNKVYVPVKMWILEFIQFVKENTNYAKLWALIWSFSFNFISIFIEFIAYYLFFVCSFELTSLYIQFLKLLRDLSVCLDFIPVPIWILLILIVIDIIRRYVGYKNLNHLELKDRGFINERPIITLLVGTMGKKKTTIVTDMAISLQIMLRDKAFETLLEIDLEFPNFPWINLENSLKYMMSQHKVYNLATCEKYIKHLKTCYDVSMSCNDLSVYKSIKRHLKKEFKINFSNMLFDYDYVNNSMIYDNKLFIRTLWEDIKDYAKLYFVYVIESSLLISNYSIRTDNVLDDVGNFPLWNAELFKTDSRLIDAFSRHSHILDFDTLRLGKKLIQNNPKANSFEFGLLIITEIGKERGNNLELQEVKKKDDKANQKNDLMNYTLKMFRHFGTIRNFCYGKILSDEQRPESWGADARDLCEIVHIVECSSVKLAMPLFAFEDLIIGLFMDKFSNKYYDYRFRCGDNTLLMYLYHNLASKLYSYKTRIYNTFAYYKTDVCVENGTQDGSLKNNNYYLMWKKIYSKRFSTDCFSDIFKEKALKSSIGINDLEEFKTEKATFEEMMKENSYFFNDLKNIKEKE